MSMQQQSLVALLHRANQIATERFTGTLGDGEVTARQVQLLAALEAHDGASQTDLVNATGIDRSTLADMVRRLLGRKLVERRRTKKDARAYTVKLTDAGRRELVKGKSALGSVEAGLLAELVPKRRADLLALLQQVVASGAKPAALIFRV